MRVVLIGCVAAKRAEPTQALYMYTSPLFAKRRAYAEASGSIWAIVSARYGLVFPHELIDPYDTTIDDLAELYQRPQRMAEAMWASRVACKFRYETGRHGHLWTRVESCHDVTFELHAGARYVEALRVELTNPIFGWQLETPVAGLAIGKQLRWYSERLKVAA